MERVVRHVVREHDEEHEQQPQAEPLPRGRAAVGQVVQAGEVFAGGNAGNQILKRYLDKAVETSTYQLHRYRFTTWLRACTYVKCVL